MEHGSSDLPEGVADCQRMIRELQQLVSQQQVSIEHYREQLERATEQITLLKKALFSPRRERFAPDPNQGQLFTPAPLDGAADEERAENESQESADESACGAPAARDRSLKRRRKRIVFPQFLPRQRREYPLPPEERPCGSCGEERVVIQTRVTEQLEIEPPKAYVVEHVRYTYACPTCREGDQVVTTQKPPQAVEKSPFGGSMLAWLVVAKFARHLPVYRHQEMLLGPLKLWLSRTLLCGLLRGTAEALRPLEARIRQLVLASVLLQVDETPVRFLGKLLGRAALGYIWAYAGDKEHPYVFYDFSPSRSRDGPEPILANYEGYLQTDGYTVYTSLVRDSNGRLRDVACYAHGRRKFDEARYTTSHPLIHEALAWVQQLYDVEDRTARSLARRTARRATARVGPDRRADASALPRRESPVASHVEVGRGDRLLPEPLGGVQTVSGRWSNSAGYKLRGEIAASRGNRAEELLIFWKPEWWPHRGHALHDRAKRPAEQCGRAALPDRCPASVAGNRVDGGAAEPRGA